jgi:hypothetical protein
MEGDTSRRRRKAVRDRLAAQLILQSYLEWRARHPSAPLARPGQSPSLGEGLPPEDATTQEQRHKVWEPDADQQR